MASSEQVVDFIQQRKANVRRRFCDTLATALHTNTLSTENLSDLAFPDSFNTKVELLINEFS